MSALRLLTASWIVPVSRPPIRGGRVAVQDGRVVWAGAPGETGEPKGDALDLGPGVLMPGLVNAHTHVELSHLAGLGAAGLPFVAWVETLISRRMASPPDAARAAARTAARALAEGGTAAVGDVSNELAHLDLLADAGLRGVVFHELIGWDPAVADVVLARAAAREGRAGSVSGLTVRRAAHAPYSVSPALFDRLRAEGGPAAVHLAEAPAESEFLARGTGAWADFLARRVGPIPFEPTGVSPVRYLDGLDALPRGLVAAHCVHVDADDRATLARRGVNVAVCPRSNRNLGAGTPDVPALLEAGVRVCVGTDSLASAESLDVLDDGVELRRLFPALAPETIVRMLTHSGAEALGLVDLGAIETGKTAALAFAEGDRGLAEPLAFLLSGEARLRGMRA